ncbi:MAG: TlpA disulfide reductase family protein [Candidatus Korobacteraceae bacterium]|jgi:peroxiredoxin
MFGSSRYNYEEFRRGTLMKDLTKAKFGSAPEPGEKVPDFELRTLEGDKIRLSELQDRANVVLTFGSATCPLTAASLAALQQLHKKYREQGVEFLFVYVREAHPGERLPAHRAMQDKARAAAVLREEEGITFPILIDDLSGKVHRRYGSLPNPTYIIDRSGRIAFRSFSSRPDAVREALEELIERQEERNVDHAVVRGGEDRGWPVLSSLLHSYRALERGGERSLRGFQRELGFPGRLALMGSRVASPVIEHPRAIAATVAAVAGVLGLGLWVGLILRRRRFEQIPYHGYDYASGSSRRGASDDYEAVGI